MDPFAKDTDGFFARHFDRKISWAISRRLLRTPITPNQITLGVTLLGVGAGACMARPGYGAKLLGAIVFLATSILDGCDGEVARAKQLTSRLGGWLDLWGDNVVHAAVFYGLGVGLYKDAGWPGYLALGKAAALGVVISVSLVSYRIYRDEIPSKATGGSLFTSVVGNAVSARGSTVRERLVKLSDAVARRDFIYAVVPLAVVERLHWFLWPCAIGANLYALVLVLLLVVTPRAQAR